MTTPTIPITRQASGGASPQALNRVTIVAVGFAVLIGAVAGVSGIAGAVIAVGLVGAVVMTIAFVHRPFIVVLGVWMFLLVQNTIAVSLGKSGGAGGAVNKLENPIILLLLLLSLVFGERAVHGRMLVYLPAGVFLLAGLASDFAHHVPISTALLGAWLGAKLWVLLFITMRLPWNEHEVMRIVTVIIRFATVVAALTFIDFVAPHAFRAALHLPSESDVRVGLESARSIFANPALLASFMFMSLCLLLARMSFVRKRTDIFCAASLAVAAVLSLRFKAVVGVLAAFAIIWVLRPRNLGRAIGPKVVILLVAGIAVGGVGYAVANKQVNEYTTTETPRNRMTQVALQLAKHDIPLGEGFGRYGSAPSSFPYRYSPVYNKVGFWAINGLDAANPAYLHDTSWATVIGETGALGWLGYAGGLVLLLVSLILQSRNEEQAWYAQMLSIAGAATVVALLVDSAGRPALFDAFTCMSVALIVGPALVLGRRTSTRSPLPPSIERIFGSV
jgi:hypothetical protein